MIYDSNVSTPQQSSPATGNARTSSFDIPKYEVEVNDRMRAFGDQEAQWCRLPFDHIQERKQPRPKISRRTWVAFGAMVLVAILSAILVAALLSRPGKREVQSLDAEAMSPAVTETVTQLEQSTPYALASATTMTFTTTKMEPTTNGRSSATILSSIVQTTTELSPPTITSMSALFPATSELVTTTLSSFPSSSNPAVITTMKSGSTERTLTETGSTLSSISEVQSISTSIPISSEIILNGPTSGSMPPTTSHLTKTAQEPKSTATSTISANPPSSPSSSVAAASPSSSRTPGGLIFFCSVPGSSCNEKRMALGLKEGSEGCVADDQFVTLFVATELQN